MAENLNPEEFGRQAGGIAHDFNNLLTAINGYADLALSQVPEDSPIRAYLDEVRRAGAKATELTRRLLVLSREQREAVLQGKSRDEGPPGQG